MRRFYLKTNNGTKVPSDSATATQARDLRLRVNFFGDLLRIAEVVEARGTLARLMEALAGYKRIS
jgi:hypothetical protein